MLAGSYLTRRLRAPRKGIQMLFSLKEKGQGLVEYAIIIALVAILVIVAVGAFGEKTGDTFSSINNSLP